MHRQEYVTWTTAQFGLVRECFRTGLETTTERNTPAMRHSMSSTRTARAAFAILGAASLLAVSACTTDDALDTDDSATEASPTNTMGTDDSNGGEAGATDVEEAEGLPTSLNSADGAEIGTVEFVDRDDSLEVTATLAGLDPGFYGFHIHGIGVCETDSAAPDDPENTGDFMSAGGHLGSDDADHPQHAGDMPQLLVMESGEATMSFETDRFSLADLEDDDGAVVMIHSEPDNYANIPERYAPEGADDDSTSTGDAGSRLACGVVGS